MSRIAIVAAMEREVTPLIRNWQVRSVEHAGRQYRFFENGDASLICGGIGPEAARRATEAILRESKATCVLSVGFAGALDPALRVGDVIEPRTVIDAGDGSRTDTGSGHGALVSFAAVAGSDQKEKLRAAYDAAAVDMEAASVAQGAESRGVSFGALKVVSDAADFRMPPVGKFIAPDASFKSLRFAFYVAVRPWLWAPTIVLARNSSRASRALCAGIEQYLHRAPTSARK